MSFVDGRVQKLNGHKRALEKTRAALEAYPDEREKKIKTIQRDVGLTEAAKALRIKAAVDEMRKKRVKLEQDADEHAAAVIEIKKRLRVKRQVEPVAQDRVRSLLCERKVPPVDVLQHARKVGDVEAVAALRAEMLFYGTEDQFHDAGDVLDACDLVMGELGDDNEAEAHRRITEIGEIAEPLPAIIKLARVADVSDRGAALVSARLEAGLAISDAEREAAS